MTGGFCFLLVGVCGCVCVCMRDLYVERYKGILGINLLYFQLLLSLALCNSYQEMFIESCHGNSSSEPSWWYQKSGLLIDPLDSCPVSLSQTHPTSSMAAQSRSEGEASWEKESAWPATGQKLVGVQWL